MKINTVNINGMCCKPLLPVLFSIIEITKSYTYSTAACKYPGITDPFFIPKAKEYHQYHRNHREKDELVKLTSYPNNLGNSIIVYTLNCSSGFSAILI